MAPVAHRNTLEVARYLAPALMLLLIGWSSQALSAPITSNTALPVAKGEFILREQLIVNQSGDDPRDLDRDRQGSNFRVAPFAGIKAPTGDDDKRDAFGRLPASVQVGSGLWDPFAGVVLTYQTLDYQVDGQFSYQAKNEANGFEAGDLFRLDASLQYRLLPRTLPEGLPNYLYGVIEANLIHQGKDHVSGSVNANSGGTRLFLTPGLQYVTKRWIAEAAVQIPVSQNLNGTTLENDYIARIGVRFNF